MQDFEAYLISEFSPINTQRSEQFIHWIIDSNKPAIRYWKGVFPKPPSAFTSTEETSPIIEIFESQWQSKKAIIKSMLRARFSTTKRIHGRNTILKKVDRNETLDFLKLNHLMPPVVGSTNYGLFLKGKLVALGTFSRLCPIHRKGVKYNSTELIRFCTILDHHVVGGLDKILAGYFKENKEADDVMTYIDKNWGNGASFEKIGFKRVDETNAKPYLENNVKENDSEQVTSWSKGSVKMLYYRK